MREAPAGRTNFRLVSYLLFISFVRVVSSDFVVIMLVRVRRMGRVFLATLQAGIKNIFHTSRSYA